MNPQPSFSMIFAAFSLAFSTRPASFATCGGWREREREREALVLVFRSERSERKKEAKTKVCTYIRPTAPVTTRKRLRFTIPTFFSRNLWKNLLQTFFGEGRERELE